MPCSVNTVFESLYPSRQCVCVRVCVVGVNILNMKHHKIRYFDDLLQNSKPVVHASHTHVTAMRCDTTDPSEV